MRHVQHHSAGAHPADHQDKKSLPKSRGRRQQHCSAEAPGQTGEQGAESHQNPPSAGALSLRSSALIPSPKEPSPNRHEHHGTKPQERKFFGRARSDYGCGNARVNDINNNCNRNLLEGRTHLLSVNGADDLVGRLYGGINPSAGSERTAPPVAFEQPPRTAKILSERSTDEGSLPRQSASPLVFVTIIASQLPSAPCCASLPELPIWLRCEISLTVQLNLGRDGPRSRRYRLRGNVRAVLRNGTHHLRRVPYPKWAGLVSRP